MNNNSNSIETIKKPVIKNKKPPAETGGNVFLDRSKWIQNMGYQVRAAAT